VAGSAVKAIAETPDLTNQKEAFKITCLKANWDKASTPLTATSVYELLTSINMYGGSTWYFENAVYANSNYIQIGDQLFEGKSSLYNETAIQSAISTVTLHVEVPTQADTSKLKDLRLLVSSDNRFSNPKVITTTDKVENNADLNFYINDPQPDKYYKLEFDVTYSNKSRILNINNVTFYSLRSATPVFSLNASDKICTVTSESGALHLIATEYNQNGTVYRDIIPEDRQAPERTVPLDDTSWIHKVAEQNEEYTVKLPEDNSHFIHIRAKSQKSDGSFSEEISKIYTADGIETSTSPSIISDSESNSEYYDLYGRRLDSPASGVCIKVSAGKTTKLITR